MARLSLSFLGTFQVFLDDSLITHFRSSNVQGLLVYLMLNADRAISRQVLATLFWPDEPDSVARTNFRQTLYQLRKLLPEQEEEPFFIVTRQTVQFNLESDTTCDSIEFWHALKRGDLATAVGQPDGLYKGELLPGFTCDSLTFEDWLRHERERLHQLALDALQQRTDWLLRSGNSGEAKALCQRQLALEPWREVAHRQLMQTLTLTGERQAALAQFEVCRKVLWQELAVEPEAETVALAEQIANGEEFVLQQRPRHNLIAPVTPFFGREDELTAVQIRITDDTFRLITLVGEGGIGKSRLALEVAWLLREHFTDGVWFVPLVGVTNDRDAIATAVALAMDQPLAGQQTAREQLLAVLRERQLLLVLDNFEHLLESADLVLDLLHQAPGVCVICTSREPLNFQAEWVLSLAKLSTPPKAEPNLFPTAVPLDPTTFPAVQLFVDRAQRANGRFQLTKENQAQVVGLCRLLAGLPLALELAAAALRHQTVPQLLTAVQQSMDTLTTRRRDIPRRHRSMRAVFDSSWALLTPAEQEQWADLSIFLGPFSVMAATAVTGATLQQLQTLQEKSLLQKQGERFVFHALLREFAAEKLADSPHHRETAVRYSRYYLQAVAELADALNGEMPHIAVQRIAGAWDNVRGAWETACTELAEVAVTHSDWKQVLAALVPLSDFCQIHGRYREGLRLFGAAADCLRGGEYPEVLAQLLTQQAAMHVRLSNYPQATALIEEAITLTKDDWVIARLQITWGEALWRQGNLAEAESKLHIALALAQKAKLPQLVGIATYHLGVLHDLKGAYEASLAYLEEALTIWQKLNNRRWQGNTLTSIGFVAQELSQWVRAEEALIQSLLLSRSVEDKRGEINTLGNLSNIFTQKGDYDKARKHLMQALQLAKTTGDQHVQATLHYNLAWNAQNARLFEEAEDSAKMAQQLSVLVGDRRGEGRSLKLLGELAVTKDCFSEAERLFQSALKLFQRIGDQVNERNVISALNDLGLQKKQQRK